MCQQNLGDGMRASPFESLAPLSILLVEDDQACALVAIGALESFGCEVTHVDDGAEAVHLALTSAFDIVLMDYHLPVVDGLLATSFIRRREFEQGLSPIVVLGLTASAMPDEQAACLNAGMDHVLSKPVLFEVLHGALVRWRPSRARSRLEACCTDRGR